MVREKTYTERITVLLKKEEVKKLEDLSRERGISLSAIIRMAVMKWLKEA